MSNRTYSPKDVAIAVGGEDISGWLSMTLGRNSDNSSYEAAADGVIAYTKNADSSGMLELEVQQQNNSVNAYLAALQQAQDKLPDDLIFIDFTISDKSGGVLGYAHRCHLQKPSNQDLAQEGGSRTWTFFVEDLPYLPDPSGFESATKAISDAKSAIETILNNVST